MKDRLSSLSKKALIIPLIFWGLSMGANIFNWLFNLQAGRILSKEEFAALTVFLSFQYLLNVPATALAATVSRFTAYYIEKGEQEKHFYFFRQFWWLTWTLGGLLLVLFLIFQGAIKSFFDFDSSTLILIFAPLVIPLFLVAFERGALLGQLSFIWVGVLFIVEALVKLVFLLILPNLPISPMAAAVAALPVSVIIAWFVSILVARSFHPLPAKTNSEGSKRLNDTYKFLGNSIFASLGAVLLYNADILLVKHFFSAFEAGVYSTLSLLGKTLYFAAGSLVGILIPLTAKAQAQNQSGRVPFLMLLAVITFVGMGIWVAYVSAPEFIVTGLLTEKALPVVPYLSTYSLGMFFLVLVTCFVTYSLAKKNYLPAHLTILAAVVQASLIFFYHTSLGQVVNIVAAVLFSLLIVLVIVEFLGLDTEALLNNITSLVKLFGNDNKLNTRKPGKSKILILNWRDVKHVESGGSEVYIQEISKRLAEKKFDITLFTSNDGKCKPYEEIDGVHIIRRGGFITVYLWAAIYYVFRFRGKFDLVVDAENGIPFFSPLYTGKPIILLVHHVHQDIFLKSLIPPFSWIANLLEAYLMPIAYKKSAIVSVSDSTADDLLKEIGLPTRTVISNGLDLQKYKNTKKSPSPLISYVGRLKKYKSIEVLLEAFKKLLLEVPNSHLVIAGEGDHRHILEKKALDLGVTERVKFLGRVSEEEKIHLLGKSWVMVQPSYAEGWGITCLEANACSTPVLASRVAGLKDAVSEGVSGYMFEYGDDQELARRLRELIKDGRKRNQLGQTARDWSKKYDWTKQSKKFSLLIKKLLQTNPKQPFSSMPLNSPQRAANLPLNFSKKVRQKQDVRMIT